MTPFLLKVKRDRTFPPHSGFASLLEVGVVTIINNRVPLGLNEIMSQAVLMMNSQFRLFLAETHQKSSVEDNLGARSDSPAHEAT